MERYTEQRDLKALDQLFHEAGTFRKSKDFRALLECLRRFPHIAPYNAMLLHIQRPGCRYVATAREWFKRFHRRIKNNALPLVILRPFGPVSFVFELEDTEGEEAFPEELLQPSLPKGHVRRWTLEKLVARMAADDVSYYESDHGNKEEGFLRPASRPMLVKRGELTGKTPFEMVVNCHLANEAKVATVARELGHLYCGHLGATNVKGWQGRSCLDREAQEFEAECVAWLVCERRGILHASARSLNAYLRRNEALPDISLDAVLRAANRIEGMIPPLDKKPEEQKQFTLF